MCCGNVQPVYMYIVCVEVSVAMQSFHIHPHCIALFNFAGNYPPPQNNVHEY